MAVARRDQLDNALRDQDWIERLTANDDFKKFTAKINEAQKITLEHRDKIVSALSSSVKSGDQRAELNEQLLITQATIDATDALIQWPKMQEANLEEARKELPELEAQIKKLKERGE